MERGEQIVFLKIKKKFEDDNKIVFYIFYNDFPREEVTFNKSNNTFEYTNNIDEKIASFRPIFWVEDWIRETIKNKETRKICAIS